MKTLMSGLVTFGACNAARWYLNRSSRSEAEYCGGRVRLRSLWNGGAAFGLHIPKSVVFGASAAVLGIVWTQRHSCPLAAGLVLGGGAGNLYERLRHGQVYDYVQFPRAPGRLKQYIFNLADGAIFLGAIALAIAQRRSK